MIGSLLAAPDFTVDEDALKRLPVEELELAARRLRLPVRDHRLGALVRLLLDPPPLPKPRRRQWRDRRWLPFAEARAFVRKLDLLNSNDWLAYCRGDLAESKGEKPRNIPATPEGVYAEDGWRGMRDWLGGEADLLTDPRYRSFTAARRFAVRLKLRSKVEWERWCREGLPDRPDRPDDIPADPAAVYPRAFRGWEDFLGRRGGTPGGRRKWLSFRQAREFARSLGLSSFHEWRAYCHGERPDLPPLPDDIPKTPNLVYRACGFTTCEDWLGTDWYGRRRWVSYEKARDFARELGLERATDWLAWVAGERPDLPDRPEGVPASLSKVYEGRGWLGWGDFLGTGNTAPTRKHFRSYAETRDFARRLGFRTSLEWSAWSRRDRPDLPPRPDDIPSDPRMVYRSRGWTSWAEFLGTDNVCPRKRKWQDFRRARAFARVEGLDPHLSLRRPTMAGGGAHSLDASRQAPLRPAEGLRGLLRPGPEEAPWRPPMRSPGDKRYRLDGIARRLKKGKSTLLRWEKEHRIWFRRSRGGQRYLLEADLQALLRATRIPPGARRKTRKPPAPRWWEE